MNSSIQLRMSVGCAAVVGIAVSGGLPPLMCLAIVFPVLSMVQFRRSHSYKVAFGYHAGASWPVIVVTQNYVGGAGGAVKGVFLWLLASTLLSLPWLWAWSSNRRSAVWRTPLALLATVLPPIGIIGWAHPLMATGYLLPGTKWFGVVAVLLLPGALAAFPRPTAALALTASALANCLFPGTPSPPNGWEAVNTKFGKVAISPMTEYAAAQWIQARALSSSASVLIFPETAVPHWTEATELFWKPTVDQLAGNGRTILVGATLAIPAPMHLQDASYDVISQIRTLKNERAPGPPEAAPDFPYRNVLLMRGAESGIIDQRVPVPLAMWRPLAQAGVPIKFTSSGVAHIAGQRAAILICYEQLITWPELTAALQRPTVFIAIANDVWVNQTPIARLQRACVRSWARALRLPLLLAANQ